MTMNEATLTFIREHAADDVRQLALRFSGRRDDGDVDIPFALDQISGRQTARRKLPSWAATDDLCYPPHLSMEQCSSEPAARYKAELVDRLLGTEGRATLMDLTGGFGVDFAFMAQSQAVGREVYVERNEELCNLARHNFPLLGLKKAEVVCSTAEEFLDLAGGSEGLMEGPKVIFMDPARRDAHGGRTYALADCTPNVLELMDKLTKYQGNKVTRYQGDEVTKYQGNKGPRACSLSEQSGERTKYQGGECVVLLKLSPMLDWRKAVSDIGSERVREVHIVSVGGECKELLLAVESGEGRVERGEGRGASGDETALFCVNLESDDPTFVLPSIREEHMALPYATPQPGDILFEPNASLMKAGCFAALSERYGVAPLAHDSHLFLQSNKGPRACSLSEQSGERTRYQGNKVTEEQGDKGTREQGNKGDRLPGRVFRVEAVSTMGKRELRQALQGITQANITTRNFPMKPEELRRKLKLKEGGNTYIFATTLAPTEGNQKRHVLLICCQS